MNSNILTLFALIGKPTYLIKQCVE